MSKILVGSRVTIPIPEDDDTWIIGMISDVEDINDDGTIMFMDDNYDSHQIELSRVQLYDGR